MIGFLSQKGLKSVFVESALNMDEVEPKTCRTGDVWRRDVHVRF